MLISVRICDAVCAKSEKAAKPGVFSVSERQLDARRVLPDEAVEVVKRLADDRADGPDLPQDGNGSAQAFEQVGGQSKRGVVRSATRTGRVEIGYGRHVARTVD